MDEKAYWIGFNKIRGIGYVRTMKLLEFFGDLQPAWNATESSLLEAGLPPRLVKEFLSVRETIDLDKDFNGIQSKGIIVLTIKDSDYPKKLLSIEQPPPVIYLKGGLKESDETAVAIVGTRNPTAYGRQVTQELSQFLAGNGIAVISGLARGIDSVAHTAVLKRGRAHHSGAWLRRRCGVPS